MVRRLQGRDIASFRGSVKASELASTGSVDTTLLSAIIGEVASPDLRRERIRDRPEWISAVLRLPAILIIEGLW